MKAYAVKYVEKPDEIIALTRDGWEFVTKANYQGKEYFIFRKKL